jgi:hypothetical protein
MPGPCRAHRRGRADPCAHPVQRTCTASAPPGLMSLVVQTATLESKIAPVSRTSFGVPIALPTNTALRVGWYVPFRPVAIEHGGEVCDKHRWRVDDGDGPTMQEAGDSHNAPKKLEAQKIFQVAIWDCFALHNSKWQVLLPLLEPARPAVTLLCQ